MFTQLNWQFESGLVLSGGIRRDVLADDHEVTRRYSVTQPLGEDLKVTASYSEGYKSPSFFALGHALVGNSSLRPERAESYQLDLDWQLALPWLWQVSLFDTRYRDLIDFDAEQFTNVNRNRVDSRGGEVALRWQGGPWQANAALSYVDIEVVGEGQEDARHLANRPKNLARIDVSWQAQSDLSWFTQVQFVDEQFASSLHTGATREHILDDYTLLNTAIRWNFLPKVVISAALDNALNSAYEEAVGFPGPGRLVRVGLELEL